MITFSHEDYIVQAIESVITQIVNFELELLVADDASPDATQTVIEEMIHSHPKGNLIRYHRHEKNRGAQANFLWALQQAKGEFIATLDGDDFWTDSNKLQKQVDLLVANPDCAGCFHNTVVLNADNEIKGHILTSVSPTKLTQMDLIKDPTQFGHTSSLLFRASSVRNIPISFRSSMCDRILVYLVAESGFWIGSNEVMSTYRLHPQGIYSPVQKSNQLIFMLGIYQSLREDKRSFQHYKPIIKKKIAYYHHELMKLFRMEGKFSLYLRHLFGYIQNEQKNVRLLKILIKEELLNRKN